MKHTEAMELDLQFFAEEGSETPEAATPEASDEETEVDTEEGEEEETAPAEQSPELNSQFAEVRRRAEAEARRRYEAKTAELNRQITDRFKGYKNPETGAPITTVEDYMEALAAQDRAKAKAQMQEAGIDPSMLDRAIANSPAVRRAEAIERQNQQYQVQAMIDEDMKSIIDFDPTVTSAADIYAQPNFNEVVAYCQNHPGTRMSDAYKLINFDRLSEVRLKAGEQAAINQAKGKSHLKIATGTNDVDKSADIPQSQMSLWKRAFPDKTPKELKALYNKVGG